MRVIPRRPAWLLSALVLVQGGVGKAQPAPPAPTPANDGALGTVEVTGAAAVGLPKLAVVPLGGDDAEATAILKKDLDRLGVWEVVDEKSMPEGPFAKDDALDVKAWKGKGVPIVVRAHREGDALIGETWILAKGDDPIAKPSIPIGTDKDARRAAHGLADQVISALTGRAGPFQSRLAFTLRTKKGRQVFLSDVDGQGKVAHGNADDTALSPTFGPGGDVWFTISKSFDPFRLVHGPSAKELPIAEPGSVLSVSFSPDRSRLAISVMRDEASKLMIGNADGTGLTKLETAKLPNRPVLGPLGKLAYVASSGTQRVFVRDVDKGGEGHPVSPAGFHASAPTFCDSPQGLVVVFTVGVGAGADLVATDTSGGNLRRLTQGHGSNAYPACSPDGRLIAFFSTGANAKSPGLYVLPLANPTRIRRLGDDHGDSLAWAR
ncbi:MAG: PD40 domain-containing protein [Deltaproteobacteria bacterium]|nr:PD40 domain-containing protein [Deltaproteobacteria bacterium]